MPRLERAARDYTIAALSKRVYHGPFVFDDETDSIVYSSLKAGNVDWRVIYARVALYLRTVRRMEAWDRWEASFETLQMVPADKWARVRTRPDTWHPLWLDAPPYDFAITPKMRREAKCQS